MLYTFLYNLFTVLWLYIMLYGINTLLYYTICFVLEKSLWSPFCLGQNLGFWPNYLDQIYEMSVYSLEPPPGLGLWQIPWLSAHDDKHRNLSDSLVESCEKKHLQINITKLDLESHQLQLTFTSFTVLMCILSSFMYLGINRDCKLNHPPERSVLSLLSEDGHVPHNNFVVYWWWNQIAIHRRTHRRFELDWQIVLCN